MQLLNKLIVVSVFPSKPTAALHFLVTKYLNVTCCAVLLHPRGWTTEELEQMLTTASVSTRWACPNKKEVKIEARQTSAQV